MVIPSCCHNTLMLPTDSLSPRTHGTNFINTRVFIHHHYLFCFFYLNYLFLRISVDRGNPEKEGAHLRMHCQTSTGTEVEELRKTLEVCSQEEKLCSTIGD